MKINNSRRTFLRGAGGVMVALPLMESLQPRVARAAAAPKRFAAFLMANGIIPENFYMTGTDTNFALSRTLAPLERHKKDCVFITGVGMSGRHYSHTGAPTVFLVGQKGLKDFNGWKMTAAAASIDQVIAKKIGADSKVESIQLGVKMDKVGENSNNCISYKAAGQPLPPVSDPYKVYASLFSDLSPTGGLSVEVVRAQRRSVLDAVHGNCSDVQKKLGTADRTRLDAYCTAVREIERKLDLVKAPGGRCEVPQLGTTKIDHLATENYPVVMKLQMDMMAMAFACDVTRVATFMVSSGSGIDHRSWLPDAPGGHHGVSHSADADVMKLPAMKERMTVIARWYYEQFANFLDRLGSIVEPDGRTVLENSVILHSNEYGHNLPPDSHYHKNIPIVLAGSAGGYFRTGTHLNHFPNGIPTNKDSVVWHNRVLTSCINAMGIPTENWGNPMDDAHMSAGAKPAANFGELPRLRKV